MSESETDSDMTFVAKSKKDNWQTPSRVLDPIYEHDHIDLDPCPGEDTHIGRWNLRLSDGVDGLKVVWRLSSDHPDTVAYVNPPFSQKTRWLRKAVGEWRAGHVDRVYILTPDSTDVKKWWHRWVVPYCAWTWFPAGRVNFIDPEKGEQISGAPHNSAVHVLGQPPSALLREWQETGDLVYRTGRVVA